MRSWGVAAAHAVREIGLTTIDGNLVWLFRLTLRPGSGQKESMNPSLSGPGGENKPKLLHEVGGITQRTPPEERNIERFLDFARNDNEEAVPDAHFVSHDLLGLRFRQWQGSLAEDIAPSCWSAHIGIAKP